tara:strand:+ start:852 stop:1139 length:288 start_codon:yes stop_codon:yes gene_type:complete
MTEREAMLDRVQSVKDNCDDYLKWGEMKMFLDRMSHETSAPAQDVILLLEAAFSAGYNLACHRSISAVVEVVYEANEKEAAKDDYGQFEQEFLNK